MQTLIAVLLGAAMLFASLGCSGDSKATSSVTPTPLAPARVATQPRAPTIAPARSLVTPPPTTQPATGGCPQGCTQPPAGCLIKGNISIPSGEKIYHVPGGAFYDATVINSSQGERWFCTTQEAEKNGWRPSRGG